MSLHSSQITHLVAELEEIRLDFKKLQQRDFVLFVMFLDEELGTKARHELFKKFEEWYEDNKCRCNAAGCNKCNPKMPIKDYS